MAAGGHIKGAHISLTITYAIARQERSVHYWLHHIVVFHEGSALHDLEAQRKRMMRVP
jgi:uncharacterized membrane-anchored protein